MKGRKVPIKPELQGRRKDRLPLDEFKVQKSRVSTGSRIEAAQDPELIAINARREQVKEIDEVIADLMAGLNERVKELRQGAR